LDGHHPDIEAPFSEGSGITGLSSVMEKLEHLLETFKFDTMANFIKPKEKNRIIILMNKDNLLLVDAHVHMYDCFDLGLFSAPHFQILRM
jgi:hypothetical protein